MNKKFFAVLLAVLCAVSVFALGACGNDSDGGGNINARYFAYNEDDEKYEEDYYLDIDGENFKMAFGEESPVRSISGAVQKKDTELTLLVTSEGVETVYMKGRINAGIIYFYTDEGRLWFCEDGKVPADADFEAIIKYDSSKGKAAVASIDNGTATTVDIPSEHDGDTVTKIGGDSGALLSNCEGLERINLPASITEIKGSVFSDFEGEISFAASSTIKTIGEFAFASYAGRRLKLPASVETIEEGAFSFSTVDELDLTALKVVNCPDLSYFEGKKIKLPATIRNIPEDSFSGCSAEVDFGTNNVLIEIGRRSFYGYEGKTVVMPVSVKTIGEEAFYFSTIESIVIPVNVTTIKAQAFDLCSKLNNVTFLVTSGWKTSSYSGDTYSISVTNPATNATELANSYYDWVRV